MCDLKRKNRLLQILEWFASRVDVILLLFDAHKLDIGDELKRAIKSLSRQVCSCLKVFFLRFQCLKMLSYLASQFQNSPGNYKRFIFSIAYIVASFNFSITNYYILIILWKLYLKSENIIKVSILVVEILIIVSLALSCEVLLASFETLILSSLTSALFILTYPYRPHKRLY